MVNLVKINGVWEPEVYKFTASMELGQSSGSATISIQDFDGTKIDTYNFEDEVEIYDLDETTKVWGGYLSDKKYSTEKRNVLELTAEDYSMLLKNRVIAKIYVTDDAVDEDDDTGQVSNIVINLLEMFPEFTTSITATDKILDRFVIDYISVKDALDKLAKLIDCNWYITPAKEFIFRPNTVITAATEDIKQGTADGNVISCSQNKTIRESYNQVVVVGGTEVTETSDTFSGDASTKSFQLTYPPRNPLTSVKIATVAKDEFKDYQCNYETGIVYFSTAPASAANNVVVEYMYDKIITAEAYSTSVDFDKRRTKKVYDRAIGTRALAQDYANALVSYYNTERVTYTLVAVDVKDTRINQYINTTIGLYGLDDVPLECVGWKVSGPHVRYELTLSDENYATSRLLAEIINEVKEMQSQSGDAIVSYETKTETLTIGDSNSAYTLARNHTFIISYSKIGATDGAGGVPDLLGDEYDDRVAVV